MRAIRQVGMVFLAALLGAAVTVAMLGAAIAPDVHISVRGINAGLFLLVLVGGGFLGLVLVCEQFSRHVEARLAAFRRAKAKYREGWSALEEERGRLKLEAL